MATESTPTYFHRVRAGFAILARRRLLLRVFLQTLTVSLFGMAGGSLFVYHDWPRCLDNLQSALICAVLHALVLLQERVTRLERTQRVRIDLELVPVGEDPFVRRESEEGAAH